jgi:cellulose synthase/poly-beta-1,6-N-acetylglucosamine synthase-like glycosyltransferase
MDPLPFLVGVVCVILFLHPYLIYPQSLRLFRTQAIRRSPSASLPSATLVFCAYNEAESMPEKIENLRQIHAVAPHIKFKAYTDLCTDNTLEILRAHSDLIDVHAATERTGKALGMRRLVAASNSDIMIFTDANVLVDPDTIPTLLRYFDDPAIGGVCGKLIYLNADKSPTARVNSLYWRMEEATKREESRSGSTMGADGSIFATRRRLYPRVPEHLLDDLIVSMSVVFAGYRLVSAPDVLAYEKAAVASRDEFRRKRRISCRAYASHRHLKPQLSRMYLINRYKYVSHRLVRWYGGMVMGAGWVAFVVWIAVMMGVLAGVAFAIVTGGVVAIILASRRGVLGRLSEMGWAIIATSIGVIDAWRGRRYQIWQPPQSR